MAWLSGKIDNEAQLLEAFPTCMINVHLFINAGYK